MSEMLKPVRDGTSLTEDVLVVLGTIGALEAIKFAFDWRIALAVAATSLIHCLVFLYAMGRKSQAALLSKEGDA